MSVSFCRDLSGRPHSIDWICPFGRRTSVERPRIVPETCEARCERDPLIRLRNFHLLVLETFPHLAVVLGLLVVVGEDLLQPGLGVSALLEPKFVFGV